MMLLRRVFGSRRVRLLLSSLFVLLLVYRAYDMYSGIQNHRMNSSCELATAGRPINYKRLVSEEDSPYSGYSLTHQTDSVSRFPDVRSCLIDSERTKLTPDLAFFDWGKIKSEMDGSVCVHRVLSSIGNIDEQLRWIESQGFQSYKWESDQYSTLIQIGGSWTDLRRCGHRYKESIVETLINLPHSPKEYAVGAVVSPEDGNIHRAWMTVGRL